MRSQSQIVQWPNYKIGTLAISDCDNGKSSGSNGITLSIFESICPWKACRINCAILLANIDYICELAMKFMFFTWCFVSLKYSCDSVACSLEAAWNQGYRGHGHGAEQCRIRWVACILSESCRHHLFELADLPAGFPEKSDDTIPWIFHDTTLFSVMPGRQTQKIIACIHHLSETKLKSFKLNIRSQKVCLPPA